MSILEKYRSRRSQDALFRVRNECILPAQLFVLQNWGDASDDPDVVKLRQALSQARDALESLWGRYSP